MSVRTRVVVSRVAALTMAVALIGGVLVGVGGGSPLVSAAPSWPLGLSVAASGFSFYNPVDVALDPTQQYLYVLDDGDRVVKVDTETDTATTLTSGG